MLTRDLTAPLAVNWARVQRPDDLPHPGHAEPDDIRKLGDRDPGLERAKRFTFDQPMEDGVSGLPMKLAMSAAGRTSVTSDRNHYSR
jgi:hypothetical protein